MTVSWFIERTHRGPQATLLGVENNPLQPRVTLLPNRPCFPINTKWRGLVQTWPAKRVPSPWLIQPPTQEGWRWIYYTSTRKRDSLGGERWSKIIAKPSENDGSLLHFRSSFHRECESGRVRFIDSPSPSMVDHERYETSITRMHPRSENQSGIPIPDRRPPLYLLVIELVDTHPRAVDELSILQVLPRYLQRRRLS